MTKILVVDDVYTTRLKTELVLRHAGRYVVQSVGSGEEALEVAVANRPDAIVLDIVMAGMDGIATLRELRALGINCPIIAFTARRERKPGEFEVRGFNAFVPKAEELSGLLATLKIVLNKHSTTENGREKSEFTESRSAHGTSEKPISLSN